MHEVGQVRRAPTGQAIRDARSAGATSCSRSALDSRNWIPERDGPDSEESVMRLRAGSARRGDDRADMADDSPVPEDGLERHVRAVVESLSLRVTGERPEGSRQADGARLLRWVPRRQGAGSIPPAASPPAALLSSSAGGGRSHIPWPVGRRRVGRFAPRLDSKWPRRRRGRRAQEARRATGDVQR